MVTTSSLGVINANGNSGDTKDLRSCVKVEVAVLCCRSLIVFMVSVDVKQDLKKKRQKSSGAV